MRTDAPIARLASRLDAGDHLLAGWNGIADPALPELLVRSGFDTVVLDMQHGAHTVTSALLGIGAVSLAGAPAIVRIPVGELGTASRLCDAGAAGIIAPMINTAAEAALFAAAVKYPPVGARSWGPHRALALSGLDPASYFAAANAIHRAIPMIETAAALEALDDILAVPGVDGVFVGPADLSIALSGGAPDPQGAAVDRALTHVVERAKAAGKFAGLFCTTGAQAKAMLSRGFSLCSVATDSLLLRAAVGAELAAAR